ncbi:hypothetical protein [Alkalibacterium sp.]|nr:MAG: DNA primase [Alkalibacterium sp.]
MKRLAKLATLSLTAGMLLAACGDADETDDTMPGTEEGLEDDGMDDGLEDDGMEDDGLEDDGMDDDLDDDA